LWQNLSHFLPNPNDPNARGLLFTPPQGFPTDFGGQTNLVENWDFLISYPNATLFPDNSLSDNWWPALTNGFQVASACGGETTNDYVTVLSTVYMNDSLWPMSAHATVEDALQVALGWWATNEGNNRCCSGLIWVLEGRTKSEAATSSCCWARVTAKI
jgi:hypothetical protein